jgi:hypothetical protein
MTKKLCHTKIDMEDMEEKNQSFEDAWGEMADDVAMVVLIGHGNYERFRTLTKELGNENEKQTDSCNSFGYDCSFVAHTNR